LLWCSNTAQVKSRVSHVRQVSHPLSHSRETRVATGTPDATGVACLRAAKLIAMPITLHARHAFAPACSARQKPLRRTPTLAWML